MDTTKIQSQLTRMERQREALERRIQMLRRKKLTALPKSAGLDSVDSLILTLIDYASVSLRARFKSAGLIDMQTDGDGILETHHNGMRAKFSPELREQIRKELMTGMKSVAEISREYGPSHPTIMGWKREWGMTRPRARRAPSSSPR